MKICGLNKTTLLDYPGCVSATIFVGGCNFRCPFCHNGDLVLWQRGSHDHIIRNDADFRRIWTYIDTNPLQWEQDIYYHRGT